MAASNPSTTLLVNGNDLVRKIREINSLLEQRNVLFTLNDDTHKNRCDYSMVAATFL